MSIIFCRALVLAQQQQSIGAVTALQGKATVMHPGSTHAEALTKQSLLYQDDTIQTEGASKLTLTFSDGTVLFLGEQSTLKITKFVYAPQQSTHSALFAIPKGIFRAIARKILPQSQFEISTTTAVAALRGTDWLGEVLPDSTAVVVLQGQVAVSHIRAEIVGEVLLTEGMGTDVKGNQPPTTPKKWGEARVNALRKAVMLP
jgi:hypothetical protein